MVPPPPSLTMRLRGRDEALLLIATLLDRQGLDGTLAMLRPERQAGLQVVAARLVAMKGKDRIRHAIDRLYRLVDRVDPDAILDVHPSWVARFLNREPPTLAGVVLATLPDRFSEQVASAMASPPPRPAVSPGSVLRTLLPLILLRHFGLFEQPSRAAASPFEILFLLNGSELLSLIEEIGMVELAMACLNLSEQDLRGICDKIPEMYRDRILLKLRQYEQTPPERVLQARQSLVHLKDELYERGMLIQFTALQALVVALHGEGERRVNPLVQRLPWREGTLLHALRSRGGEPPTPARVEAGRAEIAAKIAYLAENDRIRSMWKHYWRNPA